MLLDLPKIILINKKGLVPLGNPTREKRKKRIMITPFMGEKENRVCGWSSSQQEL